MAIRTYPRATEPHFYSLAVALQPVVPLVWGLRWDRGAVSIDSPDFSGTTDQAIQAAVDAAPVASPLLDAKVRADGLSLIERAIALTLLDGINRLGQNPTQVFAAITPQQFVNQVKAKVDTLGG